MRGCASTQVNQPGGVFAKRRGGCVGRKSRAAAKFSMTAERHPRLRGGRSEGTNIPAADQAFGPSWWKGTSGRWKENFSFSASRLPPAPCFCLWGSPFLAYNFKFIRAVAPTGVRGRHSSGSCDLQTFLKGSRVHCAGAQAPKSTKPEAIPQSAGAGVWGATSRQQFRLSGRRKSGYYFKSVRAVAQSGSALPWGGRGPGLAPSDLPPPILKCRSATG